MKRRRTTPDLLESGVEDRGAVGLAGVRVRQLWKDIAAVQCTSVLYTALLYTALLYTALLYTALSSLLKHYYNKPTEEQYRSLQITCMYCLAEVAGAMEWAKVFR